MSASISGHDANNVPTTFALLTRDLILIPTPLAISSGSYLSLYASLHANTAFCEMAFGPHFPAREWSIDETREVVQTRDIERCWKRRGMGDFAVGRRPENLALRKTEDEVEFEILGGLDVKKIEEQLDSLEWIGYAGVRDATTTSLPERTESDPPWPHYLEMVELRYGVAPAYWGKGVARQAADAVMGWAVEERGVRRFIAETEKANVRSGRVLEKMGFRRLEGVGYWQEESEDEWERVVVGS